MDEAETAPHYFLGSGSHLPALSYSYFLARNFRCDPSVNAASKTWHARGFF